MGHRVAGRLAWTYTLLLTLIIFRIHPAWALVLHEDALTHQRYFVADEEEKGRLSVAWAFRAEAAAKVDLSRIATGDPEYLGSLPDDLLDQTEGFLVDNARSHVIVRLDPRGEADCTWASFEGTTNNWCSASVQYDERALLAVFQVDAKWGTEYAAAYRLRSGPGGLEVTSSDDHLLRTLERTMSKRFHVRIHRGGVARRDRDDTWINLVCKSIRLVHEVGDRYTIDAGCLYYFDGPSDVHEDDRAGDGGGGGGVAPGTPAGDDNLLTLRFTGRTTSRRLAVSVR